MFEVSPSNLALASFIIAASSLWLSIKIWRHLDLDSQMSTKKWRKAINGPKFSVQLKSDLHPRGTTQSQAAFFNDSASVAKHLNLRLADTRWAFEESGKLSIDHYGAEREIYVRYNMQRTGSVSMEADGYESKNQYNEGQIRCRFSLINARFFEFSEVFQIAVGLAGLICDEDKLESEKISIALTALQTVWPIGKEAFGNPPFEYSIRGNHLKLVARETTWWPLTSQEK